MRKEWSCKKGEIDVNAEQVSEGSKCSIKCNHGYQISKFIMISLNNNLEITKNVEIEFKFSNQLISPQILIFTTNFESDRVNK